MSSGTIIINQALRAIGGDRITSRTDGSVNANIADDIYDEVRDRLLRSHPWNFATKRQQLSRSATAPAFEFDYAYPLPSDWIRTISVHDNDSGYGTLLYREELVASQRCIVASSDSIYLRYVYQITDANLMAADFRAALASALARDMAIPVASSNTLREEMAAQHLQDILKAKNSDAQGGFPEMRPRGSWASSRGGYRTGRDDFQND